MQPSKDEDALLAPLLSESNDNNGTNTNFENNQQNLIHHIEDDVPPPMQSEPPKNNEAIAQTAQSSRLKKCLRILVDILSFCFFLIFMLGVFALIIALSDYHFNKTDTNLSPISGALSYITFNLDSHPILDIKIQDKNISCPEDYDSMVLGTWPGTVDGCLCPSPSGLERRPCNRQEDNSQDGNCDDIGPESPIDMFDWGEDQWCVLRAKPGNQYNKVVECTEGFRKCSPGICVINSLDCPVTGIRKEGDNFTIEIVKGESPVIDVRITPNNIPCFGAESFAKGPTRPYILINEDEWGCSKYGLDDGYSFSLDSQKQEELFDQNDFPLSVLELTNYRKVYENTDSILSFRKRLNLEEKEFCLNLDTGILRQASKTMDDMQNYISGALTAGLIINSILCLWVLTFIFMAFLGPCGPQATASGEAKVFFGGSLVIGIMRTIDIIVMFGGMIYYRRKMLEIKEYFVEIGDMGCFLDKKTQSVVNDYEVIGDEVSWILLKYSIELFVVSIVTILPSFYLLWKLKKRSLN